MPISKQIDKKTLMLFIVLAVLVVGLVVIMLISSFGGKAPEASEKNSISTSIPDGEVQEMEGRKSVAFRGSISTDAYFEQLSGASADGDISLISEEPKAQTAMPAQQANSGEDAVARTFGTPPATAQAQAHAPASGRRSSGGSSVSRPMTEQERLDYDRRRAEMVRDVLTGVEEPLRSAQGGSHSEQSEESVPASIDFSAVGSSDGIISTLDDDFSDAAVQYEGAKRPFRCMFVRDQKLKSGQRVTLRLLEDYVEGGVRIPANTHLAAICKIGDRLELQVRSLEMNGRIIPLALDAYDTDGLQGIYCPETSASKGAKQAGNDAISTAGTTFGGLVGDLASTVIRTGASIARSASGELSVSVVSGYEFYLVKAERR